MYWRRLIASKKTLFFRLTGMARDLDDPRHPGRAPSVTPLSKPPRQELSFSFELFPPKTLAMEATLWQSIEQLAPFNPEYVSVTYGAGGSTRERTHATIRRLLDETTLAPAAHLTCVGATRTEIDEIVRDYWQIGVRRMVALRGDPATGLGTPYIAEAGGYGGSPELVAAIRRIEDFGVSVAAYPERHPESTSFSADIDLLKRKIDAGADEAITQFFFDNDVFERYLGLVRGAGIETRIVPGIQLIHNFEKIVGFANKAGASVPTVLRERFDKIGMDPDDRKRLAAEITAVQVNDLIDRGVRRFHFYTLNRAELVIAAFEMLGFNQPTSNDRSSSA
jgi:methylenetetrahydrofolate reductase (NADPH)